MHHAGEGRVWTLIADFTVLLAVAVILGTFWLLSAGGFSQRAHEHGASLRPAGHVGRPPVANPR